MKQIPLTQGFTALVDDDEFDRINAHKWHYAHGYAARHTSRKTGQKVVYMHREVMNAPDGLEVDHRTPNSTLDNRRENLRVCTHAENGRNRKISNNNTSGFKGATWDKRHKKWSAYIKVNGKHINIGMYDTAEEAARAYDQEADKYFKQFAKTNVSQGTFG